MRDLGTTAMVPSTPTDQRNPNQDAVTRMWAAIETVFLESEDVQMTRGALHEIVDWCAERAGGAARGQGEPTS